MSKYSPITTSLSPNTEPDDVRLALRLLFKPWAWKEGEMTNKFEKKLSNYLSGQPVFSFNSGRSSLWAILKAAGIGKGDEVIIQALSCIAVPQPILWVDAKPVYADVEKETYNIDPIEIKRKITNKTKAVIVQHSFGHPAQMDKIKKIAESNNLLIIEDCAHALGAEYKEKKVGTLGDAAFFSTGRDKAISSVFGGAAATKNEKIAENIKTIHSNIPAPNYHWILKQLLHPILFNYLVLPTYNFYNLGKAILFSSQKLSILTRAVSKEEKFSGKMPSYFPQKLPNALAALANKQIRKIDKFVKHRRKIANFYTNHLKKEKFRLPIEKDGVKHSYLRYTIEHENALDIILKARKKGILLGDWYCGVFMPLDADLKKIGYKTGSCPNAESLTHRMLNLPTHININEKKAQKIVDFLKSHKK